MHADRKLNSGKYETVGLHFRHVLTYPRVSQTDFVAQFQFWSPLSHVLMQNMIKLTTMTQKFQMLCSHE